MGTEDGTVPSNSARGMHTADPNYDALEGTCLHLPIDIILQSLEIHFLFNTDHPSTV